MDASPRRRALAARDPNASSPKPRLGFKSGNALQTSPLKQRPILTPAPDLEPKKRLVFMDQQQDEHPAKKVRVQCAEESSPQLIPVPSSQGTSGESPRLASPTPSSVFDCSMLDTSQATTLTEPDIEPVAQPAAGTRASMRALPVPPPSHPRLTREQARQKAEILRLRLGLASYKLKTGQTDVPLDRLQMRPLPGTGRIQVLKSGARPRSTTTIYAPQTTGHTLPSCGTSQELPGEPDVKGEEGSDPMQEGEQRSQTVVDGARQVMIEIVEHPAEDEQSPRQPELPRLSRLEATDTPRRPSHLDVEREPECLTSSAVRGGVANAMLSLSRS